MLFPRDPQSQIIFRRSEIDFAANHTLSLRRSLIVFVPSKAPLWLPRCSSSPQSSSSPPEAFITHLYLFNFLNYYQIGILKPSIPIQTWDSLASSQYPTDFESRWCIPFPTVVLLMWTLLEPPSVETRSQSHLVGQRSIRSALRALESFLASRRLYRSTGSSLEVLARYVAHPTPAHVKKSSKSHTAMALLTSTACSHALPGTS